MEGLGLVEGKFVSLDEYVVPIEDRGHQFGDGVYEVVIVYGGKPFLIVDHMERLFKSATLLKIEIPYTLEELVKYHLQLIEKTGLKESIIYTQITRGVAPRKHGFPTNPKPRLTMTIRPAPKIDPHLKTNGAKTILIPDERWLKCNIKSLNLLGNVLAKQEAYEKGCFEAIMHREGRVTEGSSSNLFVIKDSIIYTAPADNLILAGITRGAIIKLAKKLNFEVKEEPFSTEFMFNADEVFLTGTTTEVMPVISINDRPINTGKVGPITRKLQKAYQEEIISQIE